MGAIKTLTPKRWKVNGKVSWVIDFTENGKRRRKKFKSKTAAEDWAKDAIRMRELYGRGWLSLDDKSRIAVVESYVRAKDGGYTLSEAATNEIIAADMLTQQNDSFITSLEIETTTTSFNKYVLKIALYDVNHEESTYQTNLTINGFSNNRPVIEEVNGPQEITRPTSGETPATFTARVTDADGDDTINQVFMRIIDKETGEVTGSPFQMLDDGTNLGDETASDYIFTLTFDVTATDNRPDRDYDLQFFAVDLGGLTSDTVKTTFSIRE